MQEGENLQFTSNTLNVPKARKVIKNMGRKEHKNGNLDMLRVEKL